LKKKIAESKLRYIPLSDHSKDTTKCYGEGD
jgi:hypothetical protein